MSDSYFAEHEETKKGVDAKSHARVVGALVCGRRIVSLNRRAAGRVASATNMTPSLQTVVEKFPDVMRKAPQ